MAPRWSAHVFTKLLARTATLARSPLSSLTEPVMSGAGHAARLLRGPREASNMHELGAAWQRAFPSPRAVPIVEQRADRVIAQIITPCPLRGTGDRAACHRMMAYDRAYLAGYGATLDVLESQADGHARCLVALRMKEQSR